MGFVATLGMNELSKLQILVVDDERPIVGVYTAMLDMMGFECLTAESGEAAIGIMQDRPIDVLITDASMPGMHGFELLEYVVEHSPDTRRILITGDARSLGQSHNLMATGVVHRIVRKPCDVVTFQNAFKEQLNQIPIG